MVYITKLLMASTFLLATANAVPTARALRSAPTVNPPKIGYELEGRDIEFINIKAPGTEKADEEITKATKGAAFTFPGMTNKPDWAVTVETMGQGLQKVAAEIVVDGGVANKHAGVPLKVNDNVGERIGKEVNDYVSTWTKGWLTGTDATKAANKKAFIKNASKFANVLDKLEWEASIGKKSHVSSDTVQWGLQVTAPFPLGKLKDIIPNMDDQVEIPKSSLIDKAGFKYIDLCYFPVKGKTADTVAFWAEADLSDEARGYINLLLAYIVAGKTADPAKGLKHSTSVMPRTDFKAMYYDLGLDKEITKMVTAMSAPDLYWNSQDVQSTDSYKGTKITDFASFIYAICRNAGVCDSKTPFSSIQLQWLDGTKVVGPTVQEWLTDIAKNPAGIDLVSTEDKKRHRQISGLGNKFETVIGGKKPMPIFEFRDLASKKTPEIAAYLKGIEVELRRHHSTSPMAKRAILGSSKVAPKGKLCYKLPAAKPTSTKAASTSTKAATPTKPATTKKPAAPTKPATTKKPAAPTKPATTKKPATPTKKTTPLPKVTVKPKKGGK